MTDITELAQNLKAAAEKATQGNWRAFKYHDGRCGIGGGHHDEIMVCEHISKRRPHDAEFIALANPANVLALVEALEKAQQRNGELETYSKTALEFREAARDENRHLKLELEIAEKRIAELESRTVKLPDLRQIVSGDRYVWSDGVYNYSQDVKVALAAAGIKVEAE
ncbi:ead/Ea22-like family protein [Klebsiella pneumoniae]|uniref:ead/Ea22-like family protein n=1 Tax=Klebsiella pneumoniae TaxID=573 RepID=UPI000B417C09|nr:ead/Ea22-like family protein [Klebsiella pneumoniae]EKZ9595637.1 ead/Ea22-like family protein [Klebsiella pneumoniae]MBL4450619.1 ead/Ea22-like family protein [Klebsiella pneumoniae]MBU4678711.1 ead/Ea22-like family protein [Klebsiella pneumoniae subsp. pneumoniae]MCS6019616.1 ead/Ea22-like family protein [Klebsiella pneumoniae subsp. pneumoniae]MCT2745132.1 ead/Ea22-like family protein [Klebsiella pneumoniae]